MRGCSFAVVLALLSACWSTPRPALPRQDAVISLPLTQYVLENGLRVVVVSEPTVGEVSVTVRHAVGATDDPPGKEGLAHLVEHLMFEQARGDEAIFDVLERSALSFNGYTSADATIFTEDAAPAQLEALLELETARWTGTCSAIPAASFMRQREIVRNELRERDLDVRLDTLLEPALFTSHRQQATDDSIAAITQQEACDFAAAHYATTRGVVVISGAVKLADTGALLARTLGRVPRSDPAGAHPVAAAPGGRAVTLDAPVDRTWFVLAWPMPGDLEARTRLRAVVAMATMLIDSYVNGLVTSLEVGTGRSRQIAIAVAPSKEINAKDALANAKDTLKRMSPWFGSGLYEHAKNRAIYQFASSLEHGVDRDANLAYETSETLDVRAALQDARDGLVAMSRDDADDLVDAALDPAKATIVTLRPTPQSKHATVRVSDTFREERRRKAEDPAEARRPLDEQSHENPLARARTSTLASGLQVVLLPLSTMPTVEIRLVLPVGTADEAAGQRGVALVAAQALDPPFDTTMFEFVKQGGTLERDVAFDQTVFATRGMASHLDVLLAGVATTVREGMYDADGVRDAVGWLRTTSERSADDRVASAAWREAVYGANHPYRYASQWQHVDHGAFDLQTLQSFRAAHYRPAGATLVIAGNFDPADAQRWIEYHFHEWSGEAPSRRSPQVTPRPLAFAQYGDTAQVALKVAFALPNNDESANDLVAELVNTAIADVREQLAASYGLHAFLVRDRLATRLEISGAVDASRTTDALTLLRDRLGKLRAHDDVTAAMFVSARRHVVARLASVDTRPIALAQRMVDALDRGRPRLDLADAEHARNLTIDSVAPLLDRLDIANAALLMRGPKSAVHAAYDALGRKPVVLDVP